MRLNFDLVLMNKLSEGVVLLDRQARVLAHNASAQPWHIVYSHHEKWDGSGYPQGLTGDDIPIPARLMAVADVYDALISRRVYKPAMSHAQAAQIIVEGRGHHFDPDVVAAFVSLEDDFQAITNRYSDSREAMETKVAFLSTVIGPTNDP